MYTCVCVCVCEYFLLDRFTSSSIFRTHFNRKSKLYM